MKQYDYLIVGAGLFGSTFAYFARKRGKRCLVIDKRPHLGEIYIVRRRKASMYINMGRISSIPRTRKCGIL